MKVKELIDILKGYHPEDIVTFYTRSKKFVTILGVNQEMSEKKESIVFDLDYTLENKVEENELDAIVRERDRLTDYISHKRESEREKAERAKKPKTKRKRRTVKKNGENE